MHIVYFDEIEDPYQVTLLLQLSLSFSAMPRLLQELRASDDRYTREFGIFAVTEDGTVAGGHLLMRIPTETVDGRLDVGGVNAVGTRPDSARHGVMTRVMDATHQYFRDQGLEYSFLTTSNRLVATMLYMKLGYMELHRSRVAVKYLTKARTESSSDTKVRKFVDRDTQTVTRIFREAVKDSRGFIHRPENFLKARNYNVGRELKPRESLYIVEREGRATGYAYWNSNPLLSEAYEIIALDPQSFRALLAHEEEKNLNACKWVWSDGLTRLELRWLEEAAYTTQIESYGRALIKHLNGKTDSKSARKMYEEENGNFRLGLWDET